MLKAMTNELSTIPNYIVTCRSYAAFEHYISSFY